ncbi:MAG: 4-hydroxybenzoyl-CoA reductase subunit alpha [Syntrophorhabdus sp. PtaU1.Bin058]|nr:MAG: 4-hydroxybenzoyl-CoA reductase subunit alpha [Syntrophorhabdus sp. PtaU1.Bin058]
MNERSVVGKPLPRIDGKAKLTGRAKYTTDIVLPGMLHAKLLRSPLPHAKIRSIDTSKAEKLPGVVAVITGKDTWGIRYGFVDTPNYPAEERPIAEDKVRFIGETVAAVAAIDPDTAEDALDLIEVDYDPLPPIFDPVEAMKDGAPQIHGEITRTTSCAWEDWGVARKSHSYTPENNVAARALVTYGDIEKGFAEADYIREDHSRSPGTSHMAMEPHTMVASWDPFEEKLDVWMNHMAYELKRYWLHKTLNIPITKIRIHKTYIGGAFGGKAPCFDYEVICGFLSRKLCKPIRIELTREEVFSSCRNSHRFDIDVKTGVKKDGTIVAQHVKVIVDAGAYKCSAPVAMFLSHAMCDCCLDRKNVRHEGVAVYTNKNFNFARRGHGAPQMRLAADCQYDQICEDLGLDPVEFLMKNLRKKGEVIPNGDRLDSFGLPDAIKKSAEAIGWKEKRGKQRDKNRGVGIGINGMFSGSGYWPFACTAIIRLNHDGTITLIEGDCEFGQGADTSYSQIAAEALGLNLEDVTLISSDSELCPMNYSNFLSGGLFVGGGAVYNAALDLRDKILKVASEVMRAKPEDIELKDKKAFLKSNPRRSYTFTEIQRYNIQKHAGDPLFGLGYKKAVPEIEFYPSLSKGTGRFTDAYGFTASTAEVEVDRETGRIKVLKIVVADDCGYEINPAAIQGQMVSQAVQGMGDALYEEIMDDEGRVLNPNLVDYEIPRAFDIPEIEVIDCSDFEPKGPWGGKEAGECARAAVISAIVNAVYDATGVRVMKIPITPERMFNALKAQEK